MKILIVGSGGREHAITWKLSKSDKVSKIYCAPGNAGIASIADCVDIRATDIKSLISFSKENEIDLAVIGPESPLILGIVDEFTAAGIKTFGPSKAAAAIEGSKVFAKKLMYKYGIPSAKFMTFSDPDSAYRWIDSIKDQCDTDGIVVKADGEAVGKGVFVCNSANEAMDAVKEIMIDKIFGNSGDRVVIEERLTGQEASLMSITDGKNVIPLIPAQDYKRIFDGDKGPNTGGMGCYAPVPAVPSEMYNQVMDSIIIPTVKAMESEGFLYKGLLYTGIMITKDGPKVIEYNSRFGDPESQVVLPLMESDLLDLMLASISGNLDSISVKWYNKCAVCVVAASGGYPADYTKGCQISGLESAADDQNIIIFHAGTRYNNGYIETSGGRVLGITAIASSYSNAIDSAYTAIKKIRFKHIQYRTDIGKRVRDINLQSV